MHILSIPSWYQTKEKPLRGNFFREQALALSKRINKVGVVFVYTNGIAAKLKNRKLRLGKVREFETAEFTNNVFELLSIPKIRHITIILKQIYWKSKIKHYIKKHGRPDLVHLHSFSEGSMAFWIKEKYGIKYIVTEHSSAFLSNEITKKQERCAKEVFNNSIANIAVSRGLKNILELKYNCKFNYIPNMVDTNFFIYKFNGHTSDDFIYLSVGYLVERKNHKMLISAFKKVYEKENGVKLIIVGSGPESNNLMHLVKKECLENRVIFKGLLGRNEVRDIMSKSDRFVLPSTYEPFGVVLIEAMSCGLPVIATKCVGPETIIKNEKVGLLSEVEIDDLADKLLQSYHKRYDNQYIRNYVIDNFSEGAVTSKLIEKYKEHIH